MSKIICDVCGTTYPETASQCPICGSAKPENPAILETREPAVQKYTHVKGGRFSEKNVRKRNKDKMAAAKTYAVVNDEDEGEEERERSNAGLVITIIVLLLAIAAVLLYLYFTYLAPDFLDRFRNPSDSTVQTTTAAAPAETDPSVETTSGNDMIFCTGITLTDGEVQLSNVGDGYLLNYALEPADTTDTVTFASSDPAVAAVDTNGKITAVGPGSTVITLTCGSVQTQIEVICDIVTEPPTEETTVPETEPAIPFELNRSDFTMKVGETWNLYEGPVGNTEITWRTTDHNVATVVNGRVKAVGKGTATVTAEYNGKEYKCIVRVNG